MPNSLEAAGATREPSEYACLSMDRQITGLWTQRSPLRDADVPYLQSKFYSASRFDSLIDGLNREITARLTAARRKGTSAWNTNVFPPGNSFYPFKYIQNAQEVINVIYDGQDGTIYDATSGGKVTLMVKSPSAGKARFCGVATTLFIGDGVDQQKYVQSYSVWTANTAIAVGTLIVDTQLNLQLCTTAGVTFAGPAEPIMNGGIGNTTVDGTVTWTCKGTAVQQWGIAGPTVAPTVANAPLTSPYPAWAANTFYAPSVTIIAGTSIQTMTTAGTTGSSAPTFATTIGATTNDGTCVWTCTGTVNWQASHAYALGAIIKVTWNQVIYLGIHFNEQQYATVSRTAVFKCIVAGTSGATMPTQEAPDGSTEQAWAYPTGMTNKDGTVTWQNIGSSLTWASIGASTAVSLATTILDANGYLQNIVSAGKSGASAPTWNTTVGAQTTDSGAIWQNAGAFAVSSTAIWKYWFAYKRSVTGEVSNASPASAQISLASNSYIAVQGPASSDPWCDVVQIYRTASGQSTPLLLAEVANPAPGLNWNFQDNATPDTSLSITVQGAITLENSLPPSGFTAPVLHLGRIFGISGSTVYWSGGPDTLNGNGYCSFPPQNNLPAQELLIRLYATTLGSGPAILVFGTTNVYVITGDGTTTNPFKLSKYMADVGILNYDAMAVAGATVYLFTTKNKFVSLDPAAGYIESGFPIGDQFTEVTTGGINAALYDPSSTMVTWHEESSGDTAIYVSDGAVGWFRLSPVASPESGFLWSPRAAIVGGCSCVQSVEVSPGISRLLIGPPNGGGAISYRDPNVNTDWVSSGANLVTNLGFDSNSVGTPYLVALAAGSFCSDGWMVHSLATAIPTVFQVMLDNAQWDSAPNCLLIRTPAGIVSSSGTPTARVFWTKQAVQPGQIVRYGAATRWDQDGHAIPPGVVIVQKVALWFVDDNDNLIAEVSQDLRNSPSARWTNTDGVYPTPAGATGVYLQFAAQIIGGSGTVAGFCADMRFDNAVLTIEAAQSFPSWDTKGNITLCETGQVAEIAHIALKSMAVGNKPRVFLLLDEVAETATAKFEEIVRTSEDPPTLPESETIYSDRYDALQDGICPKCDNFQLKIDYGAQAVQDELLKFSIYGAIHNERKQQ